jgi:cation transport regulator ChaC
MNDWGIVMPDFLKWMFDGLGTALAGFVAAKARRRLLSRAVSRRARTTVFTAGSGPYMTNFYACLAAKISSARHCVYITGEGFESSSEGDSLACMLVAAMRDALSRGVPVVRLQTSAVVSDLWHSQLRALVTDFPHLFELCVPLDRVRPQPASMCAIDVDDMSRNVAEMMVGLPRFLGTRTCKVAVTAVFAEGHQVLAQSIRDQIIGWCADPAASRRLRTAAAADSYFRGEYYFAYGSNMAPAQMTARCPSALMVCVVVLTGHRLVFNRSGSYRPGGVANIEPAPGERVYGVMWKLARDEFQSLDQTEDPRAYRRERLRVHSQDGQPYDCHAYLAMADQADVPDCNYLDTLIQAGRDVGLPPEYLAGLDARRPPAQPIPRQAPGPDRHPDPSPRLS